MSAFLRTSLITLRTRSQPLRFYTTSKIECSDLRPRLLAKIKTAMKARDSKTSTTLRSVLSEINSAEKMNSSLTASDIIGIARKAVQRRVEAASKFTEANRLDLAENEQQEADLLERFLPPLLSTEEIDTYLKAALEATPATPDPRKSLGLIFKEFYSRVDKSLVDSNIVKQRAQDLLRSSTTTSA